MKSLSAIILASTLSSCAVYPVPGGIAVDPIIPPVGVYVNPAPAPYYNRPYYNRPHRPYYKNDYDFYSHHPEANPHFNRHYRNY